MPEMLSFTLAWLAMMGLIGAVCVLVGRLCKGKAKNIKPTQPSENNNENNDKVTDLNE